MKNTIILFLLALLIGSCGGRPSVPAQQELVLADSVDLKHVLDRDTLSALIGYSSTSYFIYRGKAMGYEYELLKKFAKPKPTGSQHDTIGYDFEI